MMQVADLICKLTASKNLLKNKAFFICPRIVPVIEVIACLGRSVQTTIGYARLIVVLEM
ncbi:hypothetical protein [Bacillus paramycoides]|uniref:hypothetical protein n=1 Tax=Bacillus paramycoides TaxID=2026194 RepID=UPI001ABFD5D1|nr:hypothetical protein [Bacillus paramycoides]